MNTLSRISIIALAGTLAAMAADPLMGTWKVIPASVQPGGSGPKNVVLKFETTGVAGEVKFTLSGEMNELPYSYTWTAKPGSGKHPVEGQTRTQEVEFQRPAENHTVTIHYRDGQESARHDSTISPDGKVLTTKSRSKNRAGETVESEAQYQKQ
jgi:hypothetical protein